MQTGETNLTGKNLARSIGVKRNIAQSPDKCKIQQSMQKMQTGETNLTGKKLAHSIEVVSFRELQASELGQRGKNCEPVSL